ncbi:MAG: FtsX-like permease family protein [Bacteroidales bacterium]
MNAWKLVRNNLFHYGKKNLLLALGMAISAAVLTGALIVGDSVDASLHGIVAQRLGGVGHVVKAGDRYFTGELAEGMARELGRPGAAVLLLDGSATAEGGQRRVSRVQVVGVDGAFDAMAGTEGLYGGLTGDSVILSVNLANRLAVAVGEEILLRVEKASLIPKNAPFVSDAENVLTMRVAVAAIAGESELGRFNLKVSQTSPMNAFVSRERLQELMDFTGRINVFLLGGESPAGDEEIRQALNHHFRLADAGLAVTPVAAGEALASDVPGSPAWRVKSDRVFLDDVLGAALERVAAREQPAISEPPSQPASGGAITYFVNRFRLGEGVTPYSFVSTLPATQVAAGDILINQWLADDLQARPGDSLQLDYFHVGPLRELEERSIRLRVAAVVPMEGAFADPGLMPDLPGLSDAGNCRDWDTGVPIELESIRDKDEDYWDEFGGTPKAFVSVETGRRLWQNRFGTYTSFDLVSEGADLEQRIRAEIDPADLGFVVENVRAEGEHAAGNGVSFSQLFLGLSFFLLAAGILLAFLLFMLNLESRHTQFRTLLALGLPVKLIRRLVLAEGMLVAVAGSTLGIGLSLVYNQLVFRALNGVWRDIIRSDMMSIRIEPATLALGWVLSLAIAFASLWFPVNRNLKRWFAANRPADPEGEGQKARHLRRRRLYLWAFLLPAAGALGLIVQQTIRQEGVRAPVFFLAGGLLLVSLIFLFLWSLSRVQEEEAGELKLGRLSWKNALRNPSRSMAIVILFSLAAFLVITTGSNRADLFENASDPRSGTGGFLYVAESTVPVLQGLNRPEVRYEYSLEGDYRFLQFRESDGDDASCLNLNLIAQPTVLGVDPADLEGRFSFVTRTGELDPDQPWSSLERELPGGLIPAIADETVIKWGLGMTVGDTLHFLDARGEPMDLLLVGGLAASIFQGKVLISNEAFLTHFPESSGTNFFLVDGSLADTAAIVPEIERGMRDLGWDMRLAAGRLAEFKSVTNTYLSIFMVMGALGLLVGVFGLVVVLSRSILERRRELALLKAVGYSIPVLRKLVVREYLILLLAGIGSGFLTAVVATLPAFLSAHTGSTLVPVGLWLAVLVVNGWFWIWLTTRLGLRDRGIHQALRNE